ncbi:MAG: NAD(P)/FAD-dependent oxidoreductase [Cyanobacteriota bacterium]|nr:NAD(P)/FAD-dependent oxidoreductase [Cyanobacteriota bacterium]
MAFDYDLVILGGSPVAVEAAIAANALKARVALVEPIAEEARFSAGNLPPNRILPLLEQMQRADQMGVSWDADRDRPVEPRPPEIDFDRLRHWCVEANRSNHKSLAFLSSLGIDAIRGNGEFGCQPTLHFAVNGRRLRGRKYLLAVESRAIASKIEGLSETGYLTPQTLLDWIGKEQKLPETLTIIGDDPAAIEIAQILVRLGTQVKLVVTGSHILPHEDPEAARWVQAQLEAEGVRITTQTTVTQAKQIDNKKWVQAGNYAIAADEILLATDRLPQIESFNLDAVDVAVDRGRVLANAKLQTTNPKIYACGETLGGYSFENLSLYEAKLAIKNALFYPLWSVNYRTIPWAIFSEPTLARVGLTELQARRRYSEDLAILRSFFPAGNATGFCKAIVRSNGEILGVHLVGTDASELIHLFALAISKGLKMGDLDALASVSQTHSKIFDRMNAKWQQYRIQNNPLLESLLEAWSSFRRS